MANSLAVFGYISATIFFTVLGQLLIKWGMLTVGAVPADRSQLLIFAWHVLTNWAVISGLSCSLFAAFFWILTMSKSDISFAYPFMGLSIVLVLAISPLLFREMVPMTRWLGVAVVCIGIWIASRV